MQLDSDIVDRVRNDFSADVSARAINMLTTNAINGRIARCVVILADGCMESLDKHIKRAKQDYRDVISAEHDDADRVVRDLQVSFLIDQPAKLWVSTLASVLAARGYQLKSIVSSTGTIRPLEHQADLGEGIATFDGEIGEIKIEKRDKSWQLLGDPSDLHRHNVDMAFDDENAFVDAVSGYVLMKQKRK